MQGSCAGDDVDEVHVDGATDRLLRDTFGVTDEGLRALTERAKADKAREALHPTPLLQGRAGSHRSHPDE